MKKAFALSTLAALAFVVTHSASAMAANASPQEAASTLYATHCASCHGTHAQGSALAPSLIGKSAADVHFMVDTGRMPAEVPYVEQEHINPEFSEKQIDDLVRYVGTLSMSTDTSLPEVRRGVVARGRNVYAENCEQCHGVSGNGGAVGSGYSKIAPPLTHASVFQVAEAIRVGPGVMPKFGPSVLSDQDVNDIARYVNYLQTQNSNPGGIALSGVGPVAEGFVAWFFGLGLIVAIARRLGTKT